MKPIAPIQIPWADDGDLMSAYYETVQILAPHFTYVPFMDHDAELMHRDWYAKLSRAIEQHPEVGIFACRVNRAWYGNKAQSLGIETDYKATRRLSVARNLRDGVTVIDCSIHNIISGVWFVVHAQRFLDACKNHPSGFYAVDNWIHCRLDRAGYPGAIIENILVWHRYENIEQRDDRSHLVRLDLDMEHIYGPELVKKITS